MNADFIRLAHRKAVWAELRRVMFDRYISEDAPAKEQIISEDVPYRNKEVTQEAFMECLQELDRLEMGDQYEMKQFEMKRREPRVREPEAVAAANPQPNADAALAVVNRGPEPQRPPLWAGSPDGSPEPKDEEDVGEAEVESESAAGPEREAPAPAGKRGRARSNPTG